MAGDLRPDLLFLAHRIPYPPNKGDKIRSWNELRVLARHFHIHLGCFIDDPADKAATEPLRSVCEGECRFELLDRRFATMRSASGLLTGEPLSLPFFRSHAFARWVDDVTERVKPRYVLAFSSTMAQYALRVNSAHRRVIDLIDVDSEKWRQYAGRHRGPIAWVYRREADRLLSYERQIIESFDATVLVSAHEAQTMQSLSGHHGAKIFDVMNGIDFDFFDPSRHYSNPYKSDVIPLVFTGALDYWPNIDAVIWFAREVMPDLRARHPAATFFVIGSNPGKPVLALSDEPNVTIVGRVDDMRPWLAHARVAVAPLRIARGVQNKVLEALAMNTPVVTTSLVRRGLAARTGQCVLVADAADAFGRCIDDVLADSVSLAGGPARQALIDEYSWDTNVQRLVDLLLDRQDSGREAVNASW